MWSCGELFRTVLLYMSQIFTKASQVIFRLSYVHPETLEFHTVQLTLSAHSREGLVFDRCRFELRFRELNPSPYGNSLEDRLVENVNTSIDFVANINLGLLHKFVDFTRLFLVNYYAILRRLRDGSNLESSALIQVKVP